MDRETRRTLRALVSALREGASVRNKGESLPPGVWWTGLRDQVLEVLPDEEADVARHFLPRELSYVSSEHPSVIVSLAAYVDSVLAEEVDPAAVFAGDLVMQAQRLADDVSVHVAAPIVLAGAAVEQRLRVIHAETFSDEDPPPVVDPKGMTQLATNLRSRARVNAQVVKDVTTIAGNRDAAAHGQFDGLDRATARTTVSLAALVLSRLDGLVVDQGEESG